MPNISPSSNVPDPTHGQRGAQSSKESKTFFGRLYSKVYDQGSSLFSHLFSDPLPKSSSIDSYAVEKWSTDDLGFQDAEEDIRDKIKRGANSLNALKYRGVSTSVISNSDAKAMASFIEEKLLQKPEEFLNGKSAVVIRRELNNLPYSVMLRKRGTTYDVFILAKTGLQENSKQLGQGAFKRVRLAVKYGDPTQFVAAATSKPTPDSSLKEEVEILKKVIPEETLGYVEYTSKLNQNEVKELLIMPLCSEGDVEGLIDTAFFERWDGMKLDVAETAMEILVDLHSQGIYNRDIKPANILVDQKADGSFKAVIVDWGLYGTSSMTNSPGTPGYAPPEIYKGSRDWEMQDVFGMGNL